MPIELRPSGGRGDWFHSDSEAGLSMGSIMSQRFRSTAFTFVCLLPLIGMLAMPLQADDVTINLDTSSLSAGGYFLDYQLAGTDAVLGQNTVTIANIQLGGGTFSNEALSGGVS